MAWSLVILAVVFFISILPFVYQWVWSYQVNILGNEDYDPIARFRRDKKCKQCASVFKKYLDLAEFGKRCPICNSRSWGYVRKAGRATK